MTDKMRSDFEAVVVNDLGASYSLRFNLHECGWYLDPSVESMWQGYRLRARQSTDAQDEKRISISDDFTQTLTDQSMLAEGWHAEFKKSDHFQPIPPPKYTAAWFGAGGHREGGSCGVAVGGATAIAQIVSEQVEAWIAEHADRAKRRPPEQLVIDADDVREYLRSRNG